jgi:hypothetical protein
LRVGVVRAHAEAAVGHHHHLRRLAAERELLAEGLPRLEMPVVVGQVDAPAQCGHAGRLRGDARGLRQRRLGLRQPQRVHRGVAARQRGVGARLAQLDDAQPQHA